MYPNIDGCPTCPEPVIPMPIPDYFDITCSTNYKGNCTLYTGPNIECIGIKTGMNFNQVSQILCDSINNLCDLKQDCVLSPDFGPWSECKCVVNDKGVTVCTQTRSQIVITPAVNGGNCNPKVETRDCTPKSVCFTFGSYICETEPDSTQVLAGPAGFYNNKVFYEFDICGHHQVIWYSTSDHKWHLSDVLGTPNGGGCDFTLDNGSNDYPVTNGTTQLWHNPTDGCYLNLVESTLDACPESQICFHLQLSISGRIYNFFNSVAPVQTPFDTFDHPVYSYNVNVSGTIHTITINYGGTGWFVIDSVLGHIGSLASTDLKPVGTWIPDLVVNPNCLIVSATLGGSCVQPPDVNCTLNCGPWSACVGGTQTRTCTVATPASGNGDSCPPLTQTQVCSLPACYPPTAVVPSISVDGTQVLISFTGVSGVLNYIVHYTIDGGATYTDITGTSSPIALPFVCGKVYSGTIKTVCTNGVTSSLVPFTITTDPCSYCSTEPARPMIGGLGLSSPSGQCVGLTSTGDTSYSAPAPIFGTSAIYNIVLTPIGYIYAGWFGSVSIGGTYYSSLNSIVLINCDFTPNTAFFGSGFTDATNAKAYVNKVVYDANTNRLYIAGNFTKYKGIACTPGFVVLNASTGNIDTSFAPSTVGAVNTFAGMYVQDIALQSDGKVLVGGLFTSMYGNAACKYLCRFTSAGVIDSTFSVGSSFAYSTPALTAVYTIAINSANEIFVGGVFDTYQGTTRPCLVKLTSTGSLVGAFNVSSIGTATGCAVPAVYKVVVQGTQLLIGGSFASFNGNASLNTFGRIDGTTALIDGTFALYSHLGACADVREIVVHNNKIYVGASWTGYGSATHGKYFVLNSNGTIAFNPTVVISGTTGSINAILLIP